MKTLTIPNDPKERRTFLVQLSRMARKAVESGKYGTVNDAVIDYYKKQTGAHTMASFKKWASHGFRVKKGSKGFPVWSKPTKITKESEDGELVEMTVFNVCNLFSNKQVEKPKADRKVG